MPSFSTPSSQGAFGTNLHELFPSGVVSITMRFGLHSSSFNESLRNAWTWWSPVAVPGSKDAKAITEPGCLAIFHECVVEPLRVPAPAPSFLEVVGVEGIASDDEDKGECKESSRGGGSWVDAYKRTKNVFGHDERVQVVFITPAFFGAYEARSTSAAVLLLVLNYNIRPPS